MKSHQFYTKRNAILVLPLAVLMLLFSVCMLGVLLMALFGDAPVEIRGMIFTVLLSLAVGAAGWHFLRKSIREMRDNGVKLELRNDRLIDYRPERRLEIPYAQITNVQIQYMEMNGGETDQGGVLVGWGDSTYPTQSYIHLSSLDVSPRYLYEYLCRARGIEPA